MDKSYAHRNRVGKQISRTKRLTKIERESKDDNSDDDHEEREPKYFGKWADVTFNKIMSSREWAALDDRQ